jgi:hypothetical protein
MMAETQYKTNTKAQLWTQAGNQAGTTTLGAIIELSGNTRRIKDGTLFVYEIASSNYAGKFIEMKYLDAQMEPPPAPTIHLTHTVEIYSDGSLRVDGQPYP